MKHERSTSPELNTVAQYLTEMGRYPLLEAQQEVELATHIREGVTAINLVTDGGLSALPKPELLGDLTRSLEMTEEQLATVERAYGAKDLFICSNLRLVVSIAKPHFANPLFQPLDLIQEGNLYLERAVDKFDHTKGFKFSTYATPWIRQAIVKYMIQNKGPVRVTVRAGEDVARMRRVTTEVDAATSASKGMSQPERRALVAQRLGVDSDGLARITQTEVLLKGVSLNEPLSDEGSATVADIAAGVPSFEDDAADTVSSALVVKELMPAIEHNQLWKDILQLRFGLDGSDPLSASEVAEHFGVSRQSIDASQHRAFKCMREYAQRYGISA